MQLHCKGEEVLLHHLAELSPDLNAIRAAPCTNHFLLIWINAKNNLIFFFCLYSFFFLSLYLSVLRGWFLFSHTMSRSVTVLQLLVDSSEAMDTLSSSSSRRLLVSLRAMATMPMMPAIASIVITNIGTISVFCRTGAEWKTSLSGFTAT